MQVQDSLEEIKEIFNSEGLLMVVKFALPDVMAFLINKRGAEQAEKDLRDIGEMIAERMLRVWHPETADPIKLLKEIKKSFFKKTKQIKAQVLERYGGAPSKILIRDRDCPVCPDPSGEEFEISEIHYCTAISGFVEAILKWLIANKYTAYTAASCRTIASVGSGQEACEMIIELKYGV
ncbi:MAG: hypothetical protein ACTSRS_16440 [Candidatus Helarchaeota archaeon]